MSLYRDTDEMKALLDKIRPYFDDHMQLPDNAPEEIKNAFFEYKRMADEMEKFALSL